MMTKTLLHTLLIPGILIGGLFFVSCEKPELAAPESSAPEVNGTLVSSGGPVVNETPTTTSAPEPEAEPPEFTYPELEVYLQGDTIIIQGALKSRLQKKRIADDFARDMPDFKVDDQLVVEAHRYPVGWGNRVSVGFLIPYFTEIEEPYVAYKEGIVILKGKCKDQRSLRLFQELAINIFAGPYLQDIKNEMLVSGN
ncbi:MAG: hypothetical protein P1U58_03305 [Verrucomicrobiales bacterium]|nr:hypothetical protein [Verrucomicrobiales bacterium]